MEHGVAHWDEKYSLPQEEIPWEIVMPPRELVALVRDYPKRGQALDIACGAGNYSRFLSSQGFRVTAIDYSSCALAIAKSRSPADSTEIEYIEGDVTQLCTVLPPDSRFDFIFDYSLLHHLPPEAFLRHTRQFHSLLNPGGVLLAVCYSERDPFASGRSNAKGAFGNEMYYRTRACIADAYLPLRILSYQECTLGKQNHHQGHSLILGH